MCLGSLSFWKLNRHPSLRFPPDVTLGIQAKEFNLAFVRSENLVFHGQSPLGASWQTGCHVPFTEEWLPSGHSTIKDWLAECCRDVWVSGRFSHLHRGTDQGPSPAIAQFGRAGVLGRVLVVPNFFHFRMREATVFLGDLQCCRHFLGPFPRSVPRHNPVSELYWQFLRPHGFVFALTCTVNCGTLYRQVCAFPNHVQKN